MDETSHKLNATCNNKNIICFRKCFKEKLSHIRKQIGTRNRAFKMENITHAYQSK